jgi:hypothetical protein
MIRNIIKDAIALICLGVIFWGLMFLPLVMP